MRRRKVLAATSALGAGALSGCLGNIMGSSPSVEGPNRWPQYGYDAQHTNYEPDAVGPQDGIQVSQVLTDEPPSAFLFGDDHFYYRREEGDPRVGGGTLDVPHSYTTDGTERWRQPDALGEVVALADTRVIVLNRDNGKLHALAAADGTVEWSIELPGDSRGWYPTLAESELYLQTTGGFACVDLTEPAVTWHARAVDHPAVSPGSAPQFLKPVVTDDRVISHDSHDQGQRRRVFAFDRSTGEIDWIADLPDSDSFDWMHSPTGGDDRVYVIPRDGPSRVYALDKTSGEILQQRDLDGFTHAPGAFADGTLYVVHGGAEMPVILEAINGEDLSTQWIDESETFFNSDSPVVLSDTVIARIGDFIKGFDVMDGRIRWEFSFEQWAKDEGLWPDELGELWDWPHGPIMLGDTLYVWSSNRSIFAFQPG